MKLTHLTALYSFNKGGMHIKYASNASKAFDYFIRLTVILLVTFMPDILNAQSKFIEILPPNTQLTPQEQVNWEKVISPNLAETHWVSKVNPIENALSGLNLSITIPDLVVPIVFQMDGVHSTAPNSYYSFGFNVNGSTIQLSKTPEGLIGTVFNATDSRYYGIQSLSAETALLFKYRTDYLPVNDVCGVDESANEIPVDPREDCKDSGNIIRVLFLFTKDALDHIPSKESFGAMIIAQLNGTSLGSGLTPAQVSFQSAGTEYLPGFTESHCSENTLDNLRDNQFAKDRRVATSADIVCLITDDVHWNFPPCDASGNAVNNASMEDAYCFAERTTAATQFKATHGIGHIIGMGHQKCSNCLNLRCSQAGGYAHAKSFSPASRTIMADCNSTVRVPRWSSPTATWGGLATGDAGADNARVLIENATRVSCFMPNPGVVTEPPFPSLFIQLNEGNNPKNQIQRCSASFFKAIHPGMPTGTIYTFETSEDGVYFEAAQVSTNDFYTMYPADYGQFGPEFWIRVKAGTATSSVIKISVESCEGGKPAGSERTSYDFEEQFSEIEVFPNPITGMLKITGYSPSSVITIFDMFGNVISSQSGYELNESSHTINTEILPAGVYLINISESDRKIIRKVIKI